MREDDRLVELLKFELRFLEDGGYGRSPRNPWRPRYMFQDSPSCLNFDDPSRPHPCSECLLMKFVPGERKNESSPCHFIPLTEKAETIDSFYRYGTQLDLEEALANWLRKQISRLEDLTLDGDEWLTTQQDNEFGKRARNLRAICWAVSRPEERDGRSLSRGPI